MCSRTDDRTVTQRGGPCHVRLVPVNYETGRFTPRRTDDGQ
jgi:hypothetical protein